MSGTPMEFLQDVMDCEDLPLNTRMKAAVSLAQYCHPKLEAVAHFNGENLGERLAKGRARATLMRQNLLEGKVVGMVNGEEVTLK
jgi:hypothetical protein